MSLSPAIGADGATAADPGAFDRFGHRIEAAVPKIRATGNGWLRQPAPYRPGAPGIAPWPSRAWAAQDAAALFADLPYPAPQAISWLRAKGVPSDALAEPELPRLAHVVFRQDVPWFDFAENSDDGVSALAFLARDDAGEPADIVVWSCRLGKRAAYFGAAAVLGADDISAPRLTVEAALPVHRDPLGWLRAGRNGVVILEPRRATVELRDFGPFAAEDEAHGRELQRMFAAAVPMIFVPSRRAAA